MTETRKDKDYHRHLGRLLKLLAKTPAAKHAIACEQNKYVITARNKTFSFTKELIHNERRRGLIAVKRGEISLTTLGLDRLKLILNPDFKSDANIVEACVKVNNTMQTVKLNCSESPLHRLYNRTGKNGVPFISETEFHAGERLRHDFERGQLQPRVSANLGGSVGKSGRTAPSDISDFAIDARTRVNKAIEVLGPELSCVTLDICCFLKGFELVEQERQWPPRSAKLMLKAGLSMLARHYGIDIRNQGNSYRKHFWGVPDYRPHLASI